jgi:hypothetical protein
MFQKNYGKSNGYKDNVKSPSGGGRVMEAWDNVAS